MNLRALSCLLSVFACACSGDLDGGDLDANVDGIDAASDDGGKGTSDAGRFEEAGLMEAGTTDGAATDGQAQDTGTSDAGVHDSGTHDSGTFDSGTHDSGTFDSGTFDSGTFDGGTHDADSTEDTSTGMVDAASDGAFDAGVAPLPPRRLEFHLHEALISDRTGHDLLGYVQDINAIFAKTTRRRFAFHPEEDVYGYQEGNLPSPFGACTPIDNDYAYALIIDLETDSVSNGGNAGCAVDLANRLPAGNMRWTKIFSDEEIAADGDEYYRRQITTVLHELGHLHGVGIGEYYTLASMRDNTGLPPTLNVWIYDNDDPYWSSRGNVIRDPMRGPVNDSSRFFEDTTFSAFSSRLINITAAARIEDSRFTKFRYMQENTQPVHTRVVDNQTGAPLEACDISVFNIDDPSDRSAPNELLETGQSDEAGDYSFAWGGRGSPHSNKNLARLIKAQCDGHDPVGAWLSIFDIQAYLYGVSQQDDFHYDGRVTLRATAR